MLALNQVASFKTNEGEGKSVRKLLDSLIVVGAAVHVHEDEISC